MNPVPASGAAILARPDCPTCGGTGWKRVSEQRHGKTIESAARCECVRGQRIDCMFQQARIPARYEHCELSNFEYRAIKSVTPAYLAARGFVDNYPTDERTGLMLIGGIGVGKTHLAVGILKELTLRGTQCVFYDYRELLKEIQNSWNPQVQVTEMDVLSKVFEAEVLVLDELGAVRPSEWVWDTVAHILNTRYNDKRTTIITTNYLDLPAGGVLVKLVDGGTRREDTLGDKIGDRMRSRLHEMCRIVAVEGEDFRMRIRSAGFQQMNRQK